MKIVFYDDSMNFIHEILNVSSITPYMDRFDYISNEGVGHMEGINSPFIVVEDERDVATVTLEEVIDYHKELKIRELSNECESLIMEGFEYNGDFFEFNIKDQQNFNQQISLMQYTTGDITWKTLNNGIKAFAQSDFIAICFAGEQHKRGNISKYWNKKQEILNTEYLSVKELRGITL